jgi:hypothetical protein
LQRNGHVLEADWAHVFDVVKVHSRPIHLLLVDVSMDAHVPILKQRDRITSHIRQKASRCGCGLASQTGSRSPPSSIR